MKFFLHQNSLTVKAMIPLKLKRCLSSKPRSPVKIL